MSEQTAADRLKELGIVLPEASETAAKYVNFVNVNGLLFVSGEGLTGLPSDSVGPRWK